MPIDSQTSYIEFLFLALMFWVRACNVVHAVYSLQTLNIKMDHLNSWEPTHFSQKSYLLTKNFSRKYVGYRDGTTHAFFLSVLLFSQYQRQIMLTKSID